MNELKPCPFCGGEADVIDYDDECWVAHQCANGTSVETNSYDTEAEAIAAWNSRAERTCKPTEEYCCQCGQDLVLCDMDIGPNGGAVELDPPILFNYCPSCGCKVIGG